MRTTELEKILNLCAQAAAERRDLIPVLQGGGGDGPALAAQLATGVSLVEALGSQLGPIQRQLLLGPRPGLASASLLAVELSGLARERRRAAWIRLTYPISVLLITACLVLLVLHQQSALWLAPAPIWVGEAMIALVAVSALLPLEWLTWLPGLSGWRVYARRAWQCRAIAIAIDHRLDAPRIKQCFGPVPEETLRLAHCGDGSAWCRRLADWHQQRSFRSLTLIFVITGAGLLLIAGGLVAGFHLALLQQQMQLIDVNVVP